MTQVVAALIWQNNRFLICRRPPHKTRGLLWEFVGGKVETGETKQQALMRECMEELAVKVRVDDVYMQLVHEYPDMTVELTLFNAAIVENPAWRLIWALNSIKGPDGHINIDGFYDGIPEVSKEDVEAFAQDGFDEEATKRYLGIDHFIDGATGDDLLKKLHYEPTFNICGFYSGYIDEGSKTVLPSYARVKCDIRLVMGQDPDRIYELLRKHLDDHGFGDIELGQDARLICKKTGQEVKLGAKEYQLLEVFLRNPRQIMGKDLLTDRVWGYDSEAEYNNLEVYISFVRKKLTFVGSGVKIKTTRGLGYSLEEGA